MQEVLQHWALIINITQGVTAHPPGGHRALGITAAAILTDL